MTFRLGLIKILFYKDLCNKLEKVKFEIFIDQPFRSNGKYVSKNFFKTYLTQI